MKIVVAEKVSPATLAVLRQERDWQVIAADEIREGLFKEVADADGLIVRSAVQVDRALLGHAKRLRVVGRAGVGVDNIDAAAATEYGVVVMNTPGANAIAVAELTLALMLAMARQVPKANAALHAGRWEKKSLEGRELRGKTLGIVGLGRIGLEVARRAKSFGMELVGHDPFVSTAVARENGIRVAELDELFAIADYLTLHVGLTPKTEGMINSSTLAQMKKGVRLVNCARGELMIERDLADALKSGHVAGASLDVFSQEPLIESPFFGMENVLLTPHIAGSTREAQEAVGIQIAMQVKEYLKLGIVQNAVNMPSLSHEEYLELAPWIDLADRLGSFLGQVTDGSVESIHLGYQGPLAEGKTDLVRNAAICGVLSHSEHVNRINAATVAEQRGIRWHEEKQPLGARGAGSTLRLVLHTRTGERNASGTVLHGSSPRLLSAHGVDVEAPLEGTLLCVRNEDVPGVIGRVGTILGDHGINIANFALGRPSRSAMQNASASYPQTNHAQAYAVVQVEGRVDEALLSELRAMPAVRSVRLVELGSRVNENQEVKVLNATV